MSNDEAAKNLAALRDPFPDHQVNLLPKQMKKDDQDRGRCDSPSSRYSADGQVCGGYHARAIHLSFVGHAALTDRLLDVDPHWWWEPVAFDAAGLPAFDRHGGLWIRLTLCGQTRLGYGDAQGKTGPNAVKEAIGDALRNAGMRFGAALDLWHKGDLHDAAAQTTQQADEPDLDEDLFNEHMSAVTEAQTVEQLKRAGESVAAAALPGDAKAAIRSAYTERMKDLKKEAA